MEHSASGFTVLRNRLDAKGDKMTKEKLTRRCRFIVVVVVFYVVATVVARRRGYSGLGGRTLVRCRDGHLFRTIWIPGVSVKSLRLGWWRLQYCPVGGHWAVVSPVKDGEVSDEDLELRQVPDDIPVP